MKRRRYLITGRVQGVGFRYFTLSTARRLGLSGWVRNCADGSVEAMAQGEEPQLKSLESSLRKGPSFGFVDKVDIQDLPTDSGLGPFQVTF